MAKSKTADALRRQKEARQKKILIALAPLLLGLLVWQGPGTVKALTGGNAEPPPVMAPEGGGETTGAADPANPADPGALDPATGPAPSTATPGAAAGEAATPAVLPNTNDPVVAGPGQLVTFDRFLGKDPFVQQVKPKSEDAGSGGSGGGGGDDGGTPFEPPPSPPPGGGSGGNDPPPATYTTAVIEVNGVQQSVVRRGTFPSSDPIFRLLKITRGGMEFGLVTGAFTQGQKSIAVKVGKSVTLVSQPDGQRFLIRLVAVG